MTIDEAVSIFIHHKGTVKACSSSVTVDHGRFFSYETVIAQYRNGEFIVNPTKYSMTTSRQRNKIISQLNACGIRFVYTKPNIPVRTMNLIKVSNDLAVYIGPPVRKDAV